MNLLIIIESITRDVKKLNIIMRSNSNSFELIIQIVKE